MRKIILTLFLCGILFSMNGCITSNEFNYIERAIKKQIYPARLKTNFKFSFGPISLSTAKMFVSFADKEDEAVEILREIKKVQVGVYEVRNYSHKSKLQIPQNAEKKLTDLGWEIFIRVKDRNEQVDLYYKQINKRIGSLYAVVLEKDQLVIVEVKGRLEKIIEKAVEKHGLPHSDIFTMN